MTLRPSLTAVVGLFLLFCAATVFFGAGAASANEITGLITVHDVAIGRITLSDGSIFSVPSAFQPDATKVGSVVRITFEEYGENDDEVRVTNIELVCKDLIDPFCRQFGNVQ